MVRKSLLSLYLVGLFIAYGTRIEAQESPDLHVVVNLVQLNVAVTDKKGTYITGLRPKDFAVVEDGITEKVATFAEGNEPAFRVESTKAEGSGIPAGGPANGSPAGSSPSSFESLITGANV